mmetsp:Transcript_73535/g.204319  ORF Transcript_73535/g.204319 Transcript_73535/m.204319 type:complete len:255 (+) Transcript_73535:486-1250(+)
MPSYASAGLAVRILLPEQLLLRLFLVFLLLLLLRRSCFLVLVVGDGPADVEDLDVKGEGLVGRHDGRYTLVAVGVLRRDHEISTFSKGHRFDQQLPTVNHLHLPKVELERLAPRSRRIEHTAIRQPADVVDTDQISCEDCHLWVQRQFLDVLAQLGFLARRGDVDAGSSGPSIPPSPDHCRGAPGRAHKPCQRGRGCDPRSMPSPRHGVGVYPPLEARWCEVFAATMACDSARSHGEGNGVSNRTRRHGSHNER